MKRVLLIGIVLLTAALIADGWMPDPGYAALHFGQQAIQFPLPLFIAVLIGVFTITYVVVRLVRSRTPGTREQQLRKSHQAHRRFVEGMMQLSAGDWTAAEQTLSRSANESESSFAHYLGAARAAELLGEWERRDEWISEALRHAAGEQKAAVLITQAEFGLKHNQLEIALQALQQLETDGSQNARGLGLLARIYRLRGESDKLQALEPRLRSARGVPASLINETAAQIFLDRINAAGLTGDRSQLKAVCDQLPKPLNATPEIVIARARAMLRLQDPASAEKKLRELLDHTWDEEAVTLYGEIEMPEPLDMLSIAERWLRAHCADAALLLTCARLCIRAELYGKARSYLEASLALKPRLESYLVLASLADQLGERDRAIKILNDALTHAIGRKASLPKVRARRPPDRRHADRRQR